MKLKSRLWLFTIFDFFVIAVIYFIVFRPTISVQDAIKTHAAFVEYDSNMYFCLLAAGVPLYHFLWILNAWRPKLFSRTVYNLGFGSAMVFIVLFSIVMTFKIKRDILSEGYSYCAKASQQMTISHFAVYVLDDAICDTIGKGENRRQPGSQPH